MTTPIQVRSFDVSTPVDTTPELPQVTTIALPVMTVTAIQLRVPPGPSGLVGVRVLASGVVVIPYQSADWIIADDETMTWTLEDQPVSGAWSVETYNQGTLPHTVYVRFLLAVAPGPAIMPMIPAAAAAIESGS